MLAEPLIISNHEYHRQFLGQLVSVVEDLVTYTEQSVPHLLDVTLAQPIMRYARARIRRFGTPDQKRSLRQILAKARRGKPGRGHIMLGGSRDVAIASMVQKEIARLTAGFTHTRERRKTGGYASDDERLAAELLEMDYDETNIAALLNGRTLQSAACRVVASKTEIDLDSIRVMASRGRSLLAT
jgi:hypothetical protein